MKVGLLGVEGHFSKDSGLGIEKYMYELYNNIKKIKSYML